MVLDSKDKGELLKGSLKTEFKTVYYMVVRYCRDHHQQGREPGKDLCPECSDLLEYAAHRLDCCPYGQNKPTCNRCPIHCYKPEPKEKMRLVMKYSGPRMLLSHPILALRHLFHEYRSVSEKPNKNVSNKNKRMREES